ncbi:MAG: hypothetical protein JNG85_11630 [Spirochaetaceae bacterium]|nr:hypothetical protein [Spirochaetaceae bacterium]
MSYLVFDIGSSTVKAALLEESGGLVAAARRSVALRSGPGANEKTADPEEWLEAAAAASREIIELAGKLRGGSPVAGIRAIAVSGNGPTLLAADADGRALGPALSWMDRRAVVEAAEVSRLAGVPVDSSFYLPKALWLMRNAERIREGARWFFSCPEYLAFRLSGEAVTYLPDPGYEPYIWSSTLLAALGLPAERFPPFVKPGSPVGALLSGSAERFGLAAGIPVVAGFPDFLACIVGSGSIEPGFACDRSGTSEAINLCAVKPYPGRALLSLPHAVPGLWNLSGGLSTAGKALEWVARVTGFSGLGADSLFAEAQRSPPGARGLVFLPYLAGERAPLWSPARRAAFVGLSLEHDRSDLARAACEALAFGLRYPLELARDSGFAARVVRTSGAPARNDFLQTLKADILGIPVEAPVIADCELVGDAAACALALGEASSLEEAARALVRVERRFEPDLRFRECHAETYAHYHEALAALGPVDERAAARRSEE